MSPRLRILSKIETKTDCSYIFPIKYKMNNSWYKSDMTEV